MSTPFTEASVLFLPSWKTEKVNGQTVGSGAVGTAEGEDTMWKLVMK